MNPRKPKAKVTPLAKELRDLKAMLRKARRELVGGTRHSIESAAELTLAKAEELLESARAKVHARRSVYARKARRAATAA